MPTNQDTPTKEKEAKMFELGPVANGFLAKPATLKEAMEVCDRLAHSNFIPTVFKGKSGDIFAAGMMGAEIGLDLMQSLQNIAVINGKAGLYGDVGKALLLRNHYKIEERDIKETEKLQEAKCKITRPDGQVAERTYSTGNARTAKLWGKQGPWTTDPYRQMAWRAFWFAARDIGADVLKGLGGAEELQDIEVIQVAPEKTAIRMPEAVQVPPTAASTTAAEIPPAATAPNSTTAAAPAPAAAAPEPEIEPTEDEIDILMDSPQSKHLLKNCEKIGVAVKEFRNLIRRKLRQTRGSPAEFWQRHFRDMERWTNGEFDL